MSRKESLKGSLPPLLTLPTCRLIHSSGKPVSRFMCPEGPWCDCIPCLPRTHGRYCAESGAKWTIPEGRRQRTFRPRGTFFPGRQWSTPWLLWRRKHSGKNAAGICRVAVPNWIISGTFPRTRTTPIQAGADHSFPRCLAPPQGYGSIGYGGPNIPRRSEGSRGCGVCFFERSCREKRKTRELQVTRRINLKVCA